LQESEAKVRKHRTHVSAKDRRFVFEFIKSEFSDPEGAASRAGFKSPGACWRLLDRLRDLIDAERVRLTMGTQMELDEALRLCAEGARTTTDPKVQVMFLTLVLRTHGALSDKPMPVENRRQLLREVQELAGQLQQKLGPGGKARVRAMLESAAGKVGVEAEVSADGDGPALDLGAGAIDVEASSDPSSPSSD
jgi:hypothetical protein